MRYRGLHGCIGGYRNGLMDWLPQVYDSLCPIQIVWTVFGWLVGSLQAKDGVLTVYKDTI